MEKRKVPKNMEIPKIRQKNRKEKRRQTLTCEEDSGEIFRMIIFI